MKNQAWKTAAFGAAALAFVAIGPACNEKIVNTTSIALRVLLAEARFNTAFIESVEVTLTAADATRPIDPPETAVTPVTFSGIPLEYEVKDFDSDGKRETKLRIKSNPFAAKTENGLPEFTLVFESKSAGTNPLKVDVRLFKGTRAIALGSATKNVEGLDIVTVDTERKQVEVQVRCASDFACDTGNQAPVLAAIGDQTVAENETKEVAVSATDPDGHMVTYALEFAAGSKASEFVTIDAVTGKVTLKPGYIHAGVHTGIVVIATDAGNPARSAREIISVNVSNLNRKPTFIRVGGVDVPAAVAERSVIPFKVRENETLLVRLEATELDPSGATLTYSIKNPADVPITAQLNAQTGQFSWTPDFGLLANSVPSSDFTITFVVTDSETVGALSDEVTVKITVTGVNRAPSFTGVAPQNQIVAEGQSLAISIAATDPDADTLVYGAEWLGQAPPSIPNASTAINNTVGTFAWTFGFGDQNENPYRLRLTVQDGNGGSLTSDITVTVNNVNRLPTLAAVEASAVGFERCTVTGTAPSTSLACNPFEDETVSLVIVVSDDPEDAINSLTVSPSTLAGSSFVVDPDKKRGVFTWRTSYTVGGGSQSLTFTAQDSRSGSASLIVPVTVRDVNRAPVITLTEVAVGGARCSGTERLQCVISEGDVLNVTVAVSDDAGESITTLTDALTSTTDPVGNFALIDKAVDNTTGTFTFTPTFADAVRSAETTYLFEISAIDSKGTESKKVIQVLVADDNRAPVMAITPKTAAQCTSGAGTVLSPLLCTIEEGEALGLDVGVTEPDSDDRINLFTMSAPTATGATFTPSSDNTLGVVAWTPTFTQGGATSYTLTFSAQDSKGSSVQGAAQVTVTNKNRAPQISLQAGTVGSEVVCRNDTAGPSSATCFLRHAPGALHETLLAKLSVTDPDGDNTVSVTFSSADLPQIGPAYDSAQRLFSFTPQRTPNPTTGDVYRVRFTATDSETTATRLSSTLDLTIYVGAPNQAPSLTLVGCPESVLAGSAVVCTVKVDDPDPRDSDLRITSSFLNGGSFSYNAVIRTGTFILVTPLSDSGTFQVDFTATDTEGATTFVPYTFQVQRKDIAFPHAFPVIASAILDMAFSAPYLFTVNGGFLSVFNVVNATTINTPRHTLIPAGAEKIRFDAANGRAYVLGEALKVYGINAQGVPLAPAKFNLPDGPAAETLAIRPSVIAGGTSYAFVGFPSLGQIDIIQIATCSTPIVGSLCAKRVRSVRAESNFKRLDAFGDYVVATGADNMRFFTIRDDKLQLAADVLPSGYTFGRDGVVGRPTFELRGGTSLVITLPAAGPARVWEGFAVITLPYPDLTSATQVTRDVGVVHALARIGTGATAPLLAAAGSNDVRRFSEAGAFLGGISLAGDSYGDVLAPADSTIAFATSGPPNITLSAIDVSTPTAPVKGAERLLSGGLAGGPATFQRQSPSLNVLYVPRGSNGVEVYDFSSAQSATAPLNALLPTGTIFARTLIHGQSLIAFEDTSSIPGRKHLAVFDLSANAIAPTQRLPSGFDFGQTAQHVLPFTGTAGEEYFYVVGNICKPTCATAGMPILGVWLIEITAAGLQLRNDNTPGGAPISIDVGADITNGRPAVAINRHVLYRTVATPPEVKIYDISNPKLPVDSQRGFNIAQLGVGNTPRLVYGENMLFLLGSQNSGIAAIVAVSPTDPKDLRLAGKVEGLGDTIAGVIQSRSRVYLSSTKLGITRIDVSDVDHPRILGAQEAPNNAVTNLVLHRYAQQRCCVPLTSCASALVCTTDSQCTSGGRCTSLDVLVAAEPENVAVFELLTEPTATPDGGL